MCQAYDGEWRYIVACEKRAQEKGERSKPADENPYDPVYEKYEHDAWDLGRRLSRATEER